ncbi:MAG: radical SAM protein, partial [Chloroflexi bacterium]|nr:radical SAM protein [Chloroflexota bacterium]
EKLPSLDEIGSFFELSRRALPETPIILGCARPMGSMKVEIDKMAIDAGLNGLAYPADGMVEYARQQGVEPDFVNACCGISW